MSNVGIITARRLLNTRTGEHERAGWADTWGNTLLDEIWRLRNDLERAEHGKAYYMRIAEETETKTYRALVERTAERDALRAELIARKADTR